ncbi:hypothetical protein AZE42_11920 [Rhizopogon vesiculosus]|uniref:Uncharacterized protein n=1 Tax=Rhizopogon vesiculosus TaxID=180088 RepID=A0A1J8QMT4_9AGAM|nr:hypothetical protein AZE42_11920 [Rhizopogon vesiculosus]
MDNMLPSTNSLKEH